MHISNGKYQGQTIEDSTERSPLTTRELTIKEEMFDIIGSRINGAKVLDIHDLNGMCGIESLSRGAKHVDFVGSSEAANRLIEKNLKKLGAEGEATITEAFYSDFLPKLADDKKYKVIFLEVAGINDIELLADTVKHLTDDGVMIAPIPITGGFKIPTKITGACIQEARDCEQKFVLVVTKDCEVTL